MPPQFLGAMPRQAVFDADRAAQATDLVCRVAALNPFPAGIAAPLLFDLGWLYFGFHGAVLCVSGRHLGQIQHVLDIHL
jgi:hypothetical protein